MIILCGRYSLYISLDELVERFGLDLDLKEDFNPQWEIYPTDRAPVIIKKKQKQLKLFKWGLSPQYTNKPIINARAETITEKKLFTDSFQKKRCLVPATSFFEWKKGEKKIKHRIYVKHEKIFSLAGIYDTFIDQQGKEVTCYTIITTRANGKIEPIHSRMPVIIPREKEDIWLTTKQISKLKELLIPYSDNKTIIEKASGLNQLSLF